MLSHSILANARAGEATQGLTEVGEGVLAALPSGDGLTGQQPAVLACTPVTPFSVSTGGTVPRRRFQRGCLVKRGKKPVWVGIFREDRLLTDGTIKRIQRKVVLGPCSKVSERAAYAAFQPYLDAVNVAPAPAPKVGRTLLSA